MVTELDVLPQVQRKHPAAVDVLLRFFQLAGDPNACWEWTGARNSEGYGQIVDESGKVVYAHRYIYEVVYGSIPEGHFVCHHCDNRPCVRPNHLFNGTHQDNMRDMHAKGRNGNTGLPGMRHPLAVFTDDDVREIRRRYAIGGVTYAEIARNYDVSWTTIQKIVTRATWRHI